MTSDSWHVLGAGAIGCLFASALQHAGCPTTLLLRQGRDGTPVTVTVEREGAVSGIELKFEDGKVTKRFEKLSEAILSKYEDAFAELAK